MLTFYITAAQRRKAQDRAAELDISKSSPPGQYPFVWDNRLNSVKRWYDYVSAEGKVGTIYFELTGDAHGCRSRTVRCTTEITHHPLRSKHLPQYSQTPDSKEHRQLAKTFFHALLSNVHGTSSNGTVNQPAWLPDAPHPE